MMILGLKKELFINSRSRPTGGGWQGVLLLRKAGRSLEQARRVENLNTYYIYAYMYIYIYIQINIFSYYIMLRKVCCLHAKLVLFT